MSQQLGLVFEPDHTHDIPRKPKFLGEGYVPELDQARLSRHCQEALAVLRRWPGRWFTYHELAVMSDIPVGSIRTRVSNLKAWGHAIETRTRPDRFREVRLR